MSDLISRKAVLELLALLLKAKDGERAEAIHGVIFTVERAPTIEAEPVKHGRTYNAHEVACILAEVMGDDCACDFNSIDEWLPEMCELQDACPRPSGVACWEQYLKYRETKMDLEG